MQAGYIYERRSDKTRAIAYFQRCLDMKDHDYKNSLDQRAKAGIARVLRKPAVGMTPTPDGRGYWIAASDGGIFNYGDSNFSGSEGSIVLNKPVVGVAAEG